MIKTKSDNKIMGRDRAEIKFYEERWLKILRENPDWIENDDEELVKLEKKALERGKPVKMITIGFPPELIEIETIQKAMKKFLTKKWIPTNYTYCYEKWSKKTKDWGRIHIHFVAIITKPESEIIRETFNTFKHLVTKNNIDIKCYKKDQLQNIVDYTWKDNRHDIKWREEVGLDQHYGGLIKSISPPDPKGSLIAKDE